MPEVEERGGLVSIHLRRRWPRSLPHRVLWSTSQAFATSLEVVNGTLKQTPFLSRATM